jgi:hypothetical protein
MGWGGQARSGTWDRAFLGFRQVQAIKAIKKRQMKIKL